MISLVLYLIHNKYYSQHPKGTINKSKRNSQKFRNKIEDDRSFKNPKRENSSKNSCEKKRRSVRKRKLINLYLKLV